MKKWISLLLAVLLLLCLALPAALTGMRRFGNAHYERGAEKACH